MLGDKLKDYHIILASGSPRRQTLCASLGLNFHIEVREIDEIYPEHLIGQEITDYLAGLKSEAFSDLSSDTVVITADTIVWLNGRAIGKPKDKKEAYQMLKSMSGKSHSVFSSVCLKTAESSSVFGDETIVTFKELSDEEIYYYLHNHEPYDKAGSYGVQDWIGLIGVTGMSGSYFNVMGLPVHKLYKELINFAESRE